jgi:hypothetical protein
MIFRQAVMMIPALKLMIQIMSMTLLQKYRLMTVPVL